jgi:LmbE family N-acetylglucosaminyl deacetylase
LNPVGGPDWSDVQRALVIVAHPDDADFICGGTCIQMARRGIEVTYLVLTNGDKGNHNPEITRNQLIAMRQIEQRKAASLCGIREVLFMGEEDGFLRPDRSIRKRVTQAIRRIRPELIISTHPDRYFVGGAISTIQTIAMRVWWRSRRFSRRLTTDVLSRHGG